MVYHHALACISSPKVYIISRRLYPLSQWWYTTASRWWYTMLCIDDIHAFRRDLGSNPYWKTKNIFFIFPLQTKRIYPCGCAFFVLAADEDAEPTSRGCYSTKRYLKLNFKNTTSTQVTEASRIGFTKLAEPYLGYPLNISYSNQNSLRGDDNIPSFKSDGANGLRSTRIWNLRIFFASKDGGIFNFRTSHHLS